jgi:Flp pilus assembly protein TadG
MKKNKRKPNEPGHERGQSLVELAISLPVMILLLLGAVDFGMAIFSYAIIRDAAQEGALYGSFNPDNKLAIESRARNISPQGENEIFSSPVDLTDRDLVQVEVKSIGDSCQGSTDGKANSLRVRVRYQYPILMPLIGSIIGSDTIPLTGSATNVILQPPCP